MAHREHDDLAAAGGFLRLTAAPVSRLLTPALRRRLLPLLAAAGYVCSYLALDWISYVQPVLKLGITPWNPQAGLTLAFLAVAGPAYVPATAVAALLSELLVRATPMAPASMVAASLASLSIALGYGLAAVALRRRLLLVPPATPGAAASLIGIAAGTSLAVACGYVALMFAAGLLPSSALASATARYWVGDLNGVLTVTPLLLALPRWREGVAAVRRRHREVLLQATALLVCVLLVLGLQATDELRFFYPLFVPVIWVAVRWGVPGAMLATLAVQIGLIAAVQGGPANAPLLDLQFLLLTLSMTALVLGAVVTGRLAAEARLRERDAALGRAMRFAVAGELASSLTHELNQPITALVSYLRAAEILSTPLAQQDARLAQTLNKAASEAIRAADVLKRLRDFYRGGAAPPERVRIDEVVAGVVRAFQDRARQQGVAVQLRLPENLPVIVTDRIALEMVLHNLLGNAFDACAEAGRARIIEIGADSGTDAVTIHVDDSGPGLTDDVLERLFEPFMTTKPDGMGLGLAISRSLLRGQGGDLWAGRGALGGAQFTLRVPNVPLAPTAL